MEFDRPFPRLTRYLRSFTELDLRKPFDPHKTYENKAKKNVDSDKQGHLWSELNKKIIEKYGQKSDVYKNICLLRTCARELCGPDQQGEVIEETGVMLLKLFLKQKSVLNKHRSMLKQSFGDFPSSLPDKICSLVNNLSECILEEIGDSLRVNSRNRIIPTKEAWGSDLMYTAPVPWEPPDTSYLSDMVSTDSIVDCFSMAYNGHSTESSTAKSKPTYGMSWLMTEIRNSYNNDNPPGITVDDLCESLISMLSSEKTNDQLQNELFDLLGFERFQLIETLFQHRKEIIRRITVENEKKNPVMEQKRREHSLSQVVVRSEGEKLMEKQARKEEKKLNKYSREQVNGFEEDEPDFDPIELRNKRIATLSEAVEKKQNVTLERRKPTQKELYPNVYDAAAEIKQQPGFICGVKMVLPENVIRKETKQYEEITIPASESPPTGVGQNLVPIAALDEVGQMAFSGIKSLNRIQSVVFETAYNTNENLLICAPTGAGKTNVALLTILHTVRQHIIDGVIKKQLFKIVYVAPMKALAAEMTANFSKRLACVGLVVRELTGDMQLTKTEMMETQLLVTTPEKWDVVTRKPTGDVALRKLVKLLIIDEVHLLHGDRGPVVEALVARTLRQVESSQSMIRIVGLSATLPNYIDVARFLRVNPQVGLFYFDSRFRPVPLKQTFIGVKGAKALQQNTEMDHVCYEKLLELVQQGHQVMVFVHARNATSRTANVLIEMAQQKGHTKFFEPPDTAAGGSASKAMARAKSKQLGELFNNGFSIHHAGLLRSDRSLVEKYFGEGLIKVLVCTSTLAWGVNLPAHGVIIKGTEIYDAKHGAFIDLSILDVLQIFGRAGRPQFDSSGHGTIITTHAKLSHYLSLLTNQFPIESNFISHLADNLNAEVSLGTISNVNEAVEWLSYTYLHVRMRLNPQVYGLNYQDVMDDPNLDLRRRELITSAAKSLDKAKMIRFNIRTNDLASTDVGRTSSNFYIKYDTVEVINDMLNPLMNEVDIFNMVSHAQEFQQLKVREDEMDELEHIMTEYCEYEVTSGKENLHGKVNILMQAYLSRVRVNSFSLISDLSYITQNAVRILRALFEISLRKNYALLSLRLHKLALMMEHQMWDCETPFRQFTVLNHEILEKIQMKDASVETLREMDTKEIGIFLRHQKMAPIVKKCAWEFPLLDLSVSLHPITRTVLRIKLTIKPDFKWNDKFHGKSSEAFWITVEEPCENSIYHSEFFLLTKKQVITCESQEVVMTMPLMEPMPPQYIIRATSDRWLGANSTATFSVLNLILPESHPPHTELLDLQPLPVTALNNPLFESLYKFTHFNPIQTQIFHCLYHTDHNVLLGAPTGSGKTIVAEIAMFRVFTKLPGYKVVYVAPLKALVRERIDDWKARLERHLNLSVIELTGDVTPDAQAIARSDVIVTTPEKWDGVSRSWQTRSYVQRVALIILDEVHLLGEERGPVLEVIVSRANFISAHTERSLRIVALSTALANARDLANWLNIKQMGLYNFRPSVRPVPLEVHIQGFQGKHYCPRMATMNRPAYLAIQAYSPAQPTLIFVSSRRQTRLTALDLIANLAAEDNPKQWLNTAEQEMDDIISSIKDSNLRLTLAFGIGLHHAGLQERDRKTTEELFLNQKIQVLVATGTLAWGVNLPAHLVIVKGTEYYDGKTKRYVDMPITDVLQMMGRAGRPQFDNEGVACIFVHDVKKSFYRKFLYEPFPVESSLLSVLPDHLSAEIVAGTITSKQEALDYLTWTYFFRRLLKNPTYYCLESLEPCDVNSFLTTLVDKTLSTLYDAGCLTVAEDGRQLSPTSMARIAAYYYLSYQTMLHFESKLKSSMSLEECLFTLSHAYEYAQMPVRHNEEILNGDLSKRCPLSVDPLSLDSPHVKTYLLLQAYFSRLDLPCTDYLTDLKSVLDQAFRIVQGMIDVVGESGWLVVTLRLQTVSQMLSQGRWFSDSPLSQFVDHHEAGELAAKGLTMPKLVHAAAQSYRELANWLLPTVDEGRIQQIYEVARRMPTLRVSLSLVASSGGEPVRLSASCPVRVSSQEEYSLSVSLERYPRLPSNGPGRYAYTPRFHKPKTEGWFITLGHIDSKELIALRRLPGPLKRTNVQLTFTPPSTTLGVITLTLYIMSDTYLGLDQQYDFQLEIDNNPPPADYSLF